jgi:protein tyrosine/serine phosphatase
VSDQPERARRSRRRLVGGIALASVAALALAAVLHIRSGVSEVLPGHILRCPQPSVAELRRLIGGYDIRTVISLRGIGPHHRWLRDERAACESLGVRHEAMSFNPRTWPARHETVRLVELLDSAERPILLHCRRGIDRTGFASVMARLLAGHPVDNALSELSLRRGHLCRRELCPIHLVFEQYRGHLDRNGLGSTAETFRSWIRWEYCPPQYDAELELVDAPPAVVWTRGPLRFRVRCRNAGHQSWRFTAGEHGVRLGARIIGPFAELPDHPVSIFRRSNELAHDLARAGLEEAVIAPGEERVFELAAEAPGRPGVYIIQLDMVDEQVHWFSDLGWPGVLLPIEVTESG